MCQFSDVLLAIDKVNTVPQWALDFRPGFGGLCQVYECTNRNPHDILMTAVADVSKGQTD